MSTTIEERVAAGAARLDCEEGATRYRDVVKLQGGPGVLATRPRPDTARLLGSPTMPLQRTTPRLCETCGQEFLARLSAIKRGGGKFCTSACANRRGPSIEVLFWAKVDQAGPVPSHRPELGPCWECGGFRDRDGYAHVSAGGSGNSERAHRFSWVLHFGAIPSGFWVLHHCDNPPCVRPDHLFLGDSDANVADKVSKGRQATGDLIRRKRVIRGDEHWSRKFPERRLRGDRNPSARLTADQVIELRRLRHAGMDYRALSKKFGVSYTTAHSAGEGLTWTHI